MKIKVRIQNYRKENVTIRYEPTGDFEIIRTDEFVYLKLDKQKEGLAIDLIIDEDNTLMFVENNDVFIDKIDTKE